MSRFDRALLRFCYTVAFVIVAFAVCLSFFEGLLTLRVFVPTVLTSAAALWLIYRFTPKASA